MSDRSGEADPADVTLDAYLDSWLQRHRTQVRRTTS